VSDIELLPFQARASNAIAARFSELWIDERRPTVNRFWNVPFYQALSALTGAGKTPILADAVAQIRATLPVEPLVLWISKGKAVVDQTYANFQPGGKYEHFVEGFLITYLTEIKAEMIKDSSAPFIALTTAGTFNQKDRADGTLRVHKDQNDETGTSVWSLLKERRDTEARRRSLIVVYDEGHNLSDQQTDLLLELEPDAILVASATMKTAANLAALIDRLRRYGWGEERLVYSVSSKDVVDAELVKRQIVLGGYAATMEAALDNLIEDMSGATTKLALVRAPFEPKAIYVCRTNISQDDGTPDNHVRPFKERKAPPILIWRYLVEQKKVPPADIAVYCDLKFDRREFPPPDDFVLFSGGDDDFAVFSAGKFHHIIFNLGLQEGWDDPACCFAYVDKSMGSPLQVEQVIGRVLRQPGARHYADQDLNTANFYIRVDNKQVFPQILETVRKRIAADIPEIRLSAYTERRERERSHERPKEARTVPEIHIDSSDAVEGLQLEIKNLHDYRARTANTIGQGELIRAVQTIGDSSTARLQTQVLAHSNRVMARWILRRSIQALYPEVVKTIDWSDPRFDASVEITSPAAITLRAAAERLVDIYLERSELTFERENQYAISDVLVEPTKRIKFDNALHKAYSDLNPMELEFAEALDELDPSVTWVRNPVNGGFSIPLLEKGTTRRFFPDFLVWSGSLIFALDPKGDQLIAKDAGRKLLDIRDEKGGRRIVVRLMSKGRWSTPANKTGTAGYTVWKITAGRIVPRYCDTVVEAVKVALTSR
jgi:type III restriction enzyme